MEKLRLVVLADLLEDSRHNRKLAREFRQLLFQNGFTLLQEGVYTRLVDGRTSAALHEKRLLSSVQGAGKVRLLVLTETQFKDAALLAGSDDDQENEVGSHLDVFL